MKNYNLDDTENYKSCLEETESILFLKYVGLIHELIECSSESLDGIQNKEYLKHIMINGITNTSYIYSFILLYTNNLELAVYHTQKAIIYYIEFVCQIGDDNHNLLKLNTKDATLFIYKKTIFEINEEYRMCFIEKNENKDKINLLEKFNDIYNRIIVQIIEKCHFTEVKNEGEHKNENNMSELKKMLFTKAYKIVETLIQLPVICNHCETNCISKLENIKDIISIFTSHSNYEFIQKNYWYLLDSIIKKNIRKTIEIDELKRKLLDINVDKKLKNLSICKIVNYLSC
jgi:hypothetical protein|tara:strand:+ start:586 stop:1449 length:864 start_codon:yes stop_codon:yes gene_type:complete